MNMQTLLVFIFLFPKFLYPICLGEFRSILSGVIWWTLELLAYLWGRAVIIPGLFLPVPSYELATPVKSIFKVQTCYVLKTTKVLSKPT